ncbi:hypothetical protein CEXT_177431 [Caerostris extrusa]|uniref:Uncharacterized protein n=1 Tax=Caerostris extrusa TaxID=172846 RepID=A0AAV4MAZ4_CAEEX|nr:hypothetical protein CEXT_177431 [Caerostris extrusa]
MRITTRNGRASQKRASIGGALASSTVRHSIDCIRGSQIMSGRTSFLTRAHLSRPRQCPLPPAFTGSDECAILMDFAGGGISFATALKRRKLRI